MLKNNLEKSYKTYQAASKWVDENIPRIRPEDLAEFYGFKMQYEYFGEFNKRNKCYPCCDWHERAKV